MGSFFWGLVFACSMAETEDTKQVAAEALQVEPVIADKTDAEVPAQTQTSAQGLPSGQVLAEESKTKEPETKSEQVEVVQEHAAPPPERPSAEKKQDADGPSGQVGEPETEKGLARKEQASDSSNSGYVEIQLDAHGRDLGWRQVLCPNGFSDRSVEEAWLHWAEPFPYLEEADRVPLRRFVWLASRCESGPHCLQSQAFFESKMKLTVFSQIFPGCEF